MVETLDHSSESTETGGFFSQQLSGLQEQIGVITDTVGDLGGEKMEVFSKQLDSMKSSLDGFMEFGDNIIEGILQNEKINQQYQSLSDSGIRKFLGSGFSLGSVLGNRLGGKAYPERTSYALTDKLEIYRLMQQIHDNPEQWEQQKNSLHQMYQYFTTIDNRHETPQGKSVADILQLPDQNPLNNLSVSSLVETVWEQKELISPEFLTNHGFGHLVTEEENGELAVAYDTLNENDIHTLVTSMLQQLGADAFHVLELTLYQSGISLSYPHAFAMLVFSRMCGMTNHVLYNIDDVLSYQPEEENSPPNADIDTDKGEGTVEIDDQSPYQIDRSSPFDKHFLTILQDGQSNPTAQNIYTYFEKLYDDFEAKKFVVVAFLESGWDPSVRNDNESTKDDSIGLFQINLLAHRDPSQSQWLSALSGIKKTEANARSNIIYWLQNPVNNMKAAKHLYTESNFVPWSTAKASYSKNKSGMNFRDIQP